MLIAANQCASQSLALSLALGWECSLLPFQLEYTTPFLKTQQKSVWGLKDDFLE